MHRHSTLDLQRRAFLGKGSLGFASFLLGRPLPALSTETADSRLFMDLTALGSLQPPDRHGLRLPPGFASRVVARSGELQPGAAGYRWHGAPDGGACFASADGGWVYVSNSEIKRSAGGGGVGALRFDAAGELLEAYSILSGSDNNCAGGRTPWDTWLSCEEVDRGLVWECDPFGRRPAEPRPALGLFRHEAVAVDPRHGHLYLTEDEPDGGLYRFLPARPLPDLSAGRLQIAELRYSGRSMSLVWHDVPDPEALQERTSLQVPACSHFDGGEGIAWHAGKIYFTTKGDERVWMYDTQSARLDILYDAFDSPAPHLQGVDNVTISAAGDVLVAEDGGDMQIVLLGPDGAVLPVLQACGQDFSEICGPAFDPGFRRLYFSSQTGFQDSDRHGLTYEIRRVS